MQHLFTISSITGKPLAYIASKGNSFSFHYLLTGKWHHGFDTEQAARGAFIALHNEHFEIITA